MPRSNKQKPLRERLYKKQDGKCYYCKCDTVLPMEDMYDMPCKPDNMATIEHLWNRLDPRRTKINPGPVVLSCYKCNHDKGLKDYKHLKPLQNKET